MFGAMTSCGNGWLGGTLLFWLPLVGLVFLAIRSFGHPARRPDPDQILAERFARGEISFEEFEERRRALETRAG